MNCNGSKSFGLISNSLVPNTDASFLKQIIAIREKEYLAWIKRQLLQVFTKPTKFYYERDCWY